MIEPDWEYNHLYERGTLQLNKDEIELIADQITSVGLDGHHPKELCPVYSAIIKMAVEAGVMDEDSDTVKDSLDYLEDYENPQLSMEDLR